MQYIETHAHIYLPEFEHDRADILQRARETGITHILFPAIDSRTHESMLLLEKEEDSCHAMMGLHPCSVGETVEEELAIVKQYLDSRAFPAIGEIGLDFYWDVTYKEQQYAAFHQQIGWALEKDLPICIHSRNATDECIAVVQQYPGLKGVFHCFSGNQQQAEAVMATGFYLGIGGVVTFKNGGLDKVVAAVGLSKLVLETDAPYLAPVPYRGKRNEPAYLSIVAQKVAEVTGVPIEEVAEVTTANARELFIV